MLNELIHLGMGVENADRQVAFLKEAFGFDVKAADVEGSQPMMNCYTNGELMHRRSLIVGNFQGGALLELIQPMSSDILEFTPTFGDYGVYIAKIRSYQIQKSYDRLKKKFEADVSEMFTEPLGRNTFFIRDPEGNLFQLVEPQAEMQSCLVQGKDTGGVLGCAIGVSDLAAATKFYCEKLGYVLSGESLNGSNVWNDNYLGVCTNVSRAFLTKKSVNGGLLSNLLGDSEIELIKTNDGREPVRIMKDRRWGDSGFIHLCFDSKDCSEAKDYLTKRGIEITTGARVNWDGLDSEFFYFEDPDRCYVEVNSFYTIPIYNPLRIRYKIRKNRVKPLAKKWFSILKLNMQH